MMKLTHGDVQRYVLVMAAHVADWAKSKGLVTVRVYPVPRGGVPVAYMLQALSPVPVSVVSTAGEADIIVDDLVDSGDTKRLFAEQYPTTPFFALLDKTLDGVRDWVSFPWEGSEDQGIDSNIQRLLQFVGENPAREGLQETPKRVAKAWKHWTSGYDVDIGKLLKVFEDGGERYDQMVLVRDIPIYSKCEHHLADIFGTASIAYIPNGKIVGLSKLSRVADAFARRLQVQERLTDQIADALVEHLQPLGVGVIVRARHMCMESRGICQQGHHTVTTALRGAMRDDAQTRAEFLLLAK